MNNSRNAIDYQVTKKPSGLNILVRIILIILYIAIFVGIIVAAYIPFGIIGIVGGGVLAPILAYLAFRLTWRHVSYDFRYQIYVPSAGLDKVPHTVFQMDKMKLDNKKDTVPHLIYKNELRNADCIAPYVPENKDKYAAPDVKRTIDFRSSPKLTKDIYFLRFKDEDGSKTVAIVEAVNKIVDSFKHYAGDVTEVVELSR